MLLGQPLSLGFQISNFFARVFYGLSCKDRYYLSLLSVRCANTALYVQTTNMALTKFIYYAGIQFSSRGGGGVGATTSSDKHAFSIPTCFVRGAPNDLRSVCTSP